MQMFITNPTKSDKGENIRHDSRPLYSPPVANKIESDLNQRLAAWLHYYWLERHVDQAEVAALMDTQQSVVSQLAHGKRGFSLRYLVGLYALSRSCGDQVSVDQFLESCPWHVHLGYSPERLQAEILSRPAMKRGRSGERDGFIEALAADVRLFRSPSTGRYSLLMRTPILGSNTDQRWPETKPPKSD